MERSVMLIGVLCIAATTHASEDKAKAKTPVAEPRDDLREGIPPDIQEKVNRLRGVDPVGNRKTCTSLGGKVVEGPRSGFRCQNLPQPKVRWKKVPRDHKKACLRSGGTWRQFTNTHTDPCEVTRPPFAGASLTMGCDCGPDKCFLQNAKRRRTCVKNPPWHHAYRH